MYQVYGLIDPDDLLIGYVGVTTQPLAHRLAEHVSETGAGRGSRMKQMWLKDILDSGARPGIVELDRCDASEWQERERFWIALLKERGYKLCNQAEGGLGQHGTSHEVETRAKISESMSAYHRTRRENPTE